MLREGITADIANRIPLDTNICRWAIDYGRTGIDEKEAMIWMLKKLYRAYEGITGPIDNHELRHWLYQECFMENGEGFEQ